MSKDKAQSRRRLEVKFLEWNAVFIPDYDISVGTASEYAYSRNSHSVEYDFLCIGDFCVQRDDAAISAIHRTGSLAVSLVFQDVGEGKYERVGILERTRGQEVKSDYRSEDDKFPWEKGWKRREGLILI